MKPYHQSDKCVCKDCGTVVSKKKMVRHKLERCGMHQARKKTFLKRKLAKGIRLIRDDKGKFRETSIISTEKEEEEKKEQKASTT